jgi:hypothetical protein
VKFVIDRSKWLHPEVRRILNTSMLNHAGSGCQCCLGQIAEQCGVDPQAMGEEGHVALLAEYERSLLPESFWIGGLHSKFGPQQASELLRIMEVNDGYLQPFGRLEEDGLSLAEREAKLAELFSKLDIEIEFTGDPSIAVQRALDYVSKKEDTKLVA